MTMQSQAPAVVDQSDFRRAMSSFASGVNIITVVDDRGRSYGMTATAFCSVSPDPPLVLVCVNRESRTHDLIESTGRFGVSMLSGNAVEVSNHCARPGAHKALPDEWLGDSGASQTPVLRGALVHVDCLVHDRLDAGTHAIFVGLVEHLDFGEESYPLLYFRGAYGSFAEVD